MAASFVVTVDSDNRFEQLFKIYVFKLNARLNKLKTFFVSKDRECEQFARIKSSLLMLVCVTFLTLDRNLPQCLVSQNTQN